MSRLEGNFLGGMAISSMARFEAARAEESLSDLRARALETPIPPGLALDPGGFDLIAEIKLRAPSAGVLAQPADPLAAVAERARSYERAGAAAISVLTEPDHFNGALPHLTTAAAACAIPVMRKDFLVHPYQVWEARAAGAGGVLLIARMLEDELLSEMLETARDAGLFTLLEVFDGDDLERANIATQGWPETAPPLLIGVNARDLVTLKVAPMRVLMLGSLIGAHAIPVAESGLTEASDAKAVREAGYRLALVGTALMSAENPEGLAASLLEAGRDR